MTTLTLYAAPMSSATPVVCAVTELDVPCEVVMLDLKAGDQKRAQYLRLNPMGVVPTLVVDGTPLFESVAIMQWLGDRYGVAKGLWPAADDPARLTALSWTTWAYVTFGGLLGALNFAQSPMVDQGLHHPPLAAEAMRRLGGQLDLLEAQLAGNRFLYGDAFSLADLIVAGVITYGTYCGVQLDGHPRIREWLQHFHARDSFRKVWAEESGE